MAVHHDHRGHHGTVTNLMAQLQADNNVHTLTSYLSLLWNKLFVDSHTCTVESCSCAP